MTGRSSATLYRNSFFMPFRAKRIGAASLFNVDICPEVSCQTLNLKGCSERRQF
jgi:hypothetical protein